ncbi:heme oxygenase 2-like isoform X1 [Carassius auratus]|uniref:heme oxygenase (biliverdin-producing) n=3 Tax=Carassius auratus TaxID=7957 RepID=A0A6P6KII8_CARAU|nr:heme oxygenase 2-like isoform X1 [Carassius auratus]
MCLSSQTSDPTKDAGMSAVRTEDAADGRSTANGRGVCDERGVTVLSPTDLSEMLAAGTKEVHEKAENTEFVKDFLKGRIRKELFKLGHVALFFTYSALEEQIERNKEHPHLAALYFPHELHRRDALARDLRYFYGEDWQNQISISPATQRYVERIRQIGRDQPALLVAHAYTRYMGDLSGGQVLRKVAQRAMKLPHTGEGLNFYQFDSIHSAKAFKQLYRSRMNELELDALTKQKIVEEAVLAFQFNMEIFGELEEAGKTLQDDVLDAAPVHGEMQGDISQCPYYAAKMAASDGSSYICQMAMTVLKNPSGQVLLAAWIAALAGLAAWYLM